VSDMGMEKPADDALEQDRDVVETGEETGAPRGDVPLDVDEADAADQERAVEIDEDDYRLARDAVAEPHSTGDPAGWQAPATARPLVSPPGGRASPAGRGCTPHIQLPRRPG